MKNKSSLSVIIAAAGRSRRLAADVRKPFITVGRKPILNYSLETFSALDETAEIILAVNKNDFERTLTRLRPRFKKYKIAAVVKGGKERFDSILRALAMLTTDSAYIAVHDAARPFISSELIRAVFRAARKVGAAVPAVELSDTVKCMADKGLVDVTLNRTSLRAVQTPQIFRRDRLLGAYERAAQNHLRPTDDAQVLEAAGYPVALVSGERLNIKITHPEDLVLARAIAAHYRKPRKR